MRRKAALVAHIEEHLANADKRFSGEFLTVGIRLKKRRKTLIGRHPFRLKLVNQGAFSAGSSLCLIRDVHRFAIIPFELGDVRALLEMRC